jgi:GNAT superfamily N-acetyltransferase
MKIRPARPDDAAAISAHTMEVQAIHFDALPETFLPPGPWTLPVAAVHELMARPDRIFFVAEIDGRIVGHAYAEVQRQEESSFKRAATRLYVHQMAVTAAARGTGVGSQLLAAMRAAAVERGISTIGLDVYSFNTSARRFYDREGFRPTRDFLTLELDTPEAR